MADFTYQVVLNAVPVDISFYDDVDTLTVEESVDATSTLTLKMAINLNDDGTWSYLDEGKFTLFQPIKVLLGFADQSGVQGVVQNLLSGGSIDPVFDGYIVDIQVSLDQEPDNSFMQVTAMDAGVLMGLLEKVAAWTNITDGGIVRTILTSYGLTASIDDTSVTHQQDVTTVFQRSTDLEFVRALARKNGREFYLETDKTTGLTSAYWREPQLTGRAQPTLSVQFGDKSNLTQFTVRMDGRLPQDIGIVQLDVPTASDQVAQANRSDWPSLGSQNLVALRTGTAATQAISAINPQLLPLGTPTSDETEMTAMAQAILDRSGWFVTANGEVDTEAYEQVLRPRRLVAIRGASTLHSGNYYVTQVVHTVAQGSYGVSFEACRNGVGLTGTETF